jgi:hypothetical protein
MRLFYSSLRNDTLRAETYSENVGNNMFRKTNLAATPLYRTVAGKVSGLVAPVADCPVIPVRLDDVV